MFKFIKKLLGVGTKPTTPAPQAPYKLEPPADKVLITRIAVPESNAKLPVAESKPRRAKNTKGQFVGDNPNTPQNEAWVDGKAPAKKTKPKTSKPKTAKPKK